jgi:hypothetical protein
MVTFVLAGVLGTLLAVSGAVDDLDQADPSSPAETVTTVPRPFRDIQFGRQVSLPARSLFLPVQTPPKQDTDPGIFLAPRDTETTFVIGREVPARCTDTRAFVTHVDGALVRQEPRACVKK